MTRQEMLTLREDFGGWVTLEEQEALLPSAFVEAGKDIFPLPFEQFAGRQLIRDYCAAYRNWVADPSWWHEERLFAVLHPKMEAAVDGFLDQRNCAGLAQPTARPGHLDPMPPPERLATLRAPRLRRIPGR